MANFIPQEDMAFDIFQVNVTTYITAHQPGTANPWGYPQQRVNTLNTKKNRWDAAWAKAKFKTSRNEGDVTEKNAARIDYEADLRFFVKEWLKFNELVSDQQRTLMGIPNNDTEPSPKPAPQTHPIIIGVDFSQPQTHKINFRDQAAGNKAKPFGVAYAEIKYAVGTVAPASADDCPNSVTPTRTPEIITFANGSTGKRAYYFLRWVNTVGVAGPWSPIADYLIS